ncbi:MAG TPA: hypothetical protein DIC36_03170 [Gammaproteobacteria bacterium]|nr:hypothetical protein [Gammaproteobacteria bacterium]
MALIAELSRLYMVVGLGARAHAVALNMAKITLPRRALEDPARMTGLTFDLGMRAGERESGA